MQSQIPHCLEADSSPTAKLLTYAVNVLTLDIHSAMMRVSNVHTSGDDYA